ncbi:FG-GAP repeat domain-containing protein [Streptomyces sp. NPDC048441]|uniref:FG-GAP repeat domain-containing protein n=1 Tax=Streptomyces sp. NPDC048441 TaxID=3365552 RepID=UPI0037121580
MRTLRRVGLLALCCTTALLAAGCGGAPDGGSARSEVRPPLKGSPAVGKASKDPDTGDFNGDGFDDYAVEVDFNGPDASRADTELAVVYGSAKGLLTGSSVRVPDGEGGESGESPKDGKGGGDGFFSEPLRADLDGDGFTDLIGSRGEYPDFQTFALFGGARGLSAPKNLYVPDGFRPLAAGDFDGDGTVDLLDGGVGTTDDESGAEWDPRLPAERERGEVLFGPFNRTGTPTRSWAMDFSQHGYTTPLEAHTGDFDADGRTDVLLPYTFDAEQDDLAPDDLTALAYYRGDTKGGLVPGPDVKPDLYDAMSTLDGLRGVTVADADGDGIDDVIGSGEASDHHAGGGSDPGEITIIYGAKSGLGKGRSAKKIEQKASTWGFGPRVGDVTGDKVPDLVLGDNDPKESGGEVSLLPGTSEGPDLDSAHTVSPLTEGLPSTGGKPYKWTEFGTDELLDFNGDGRQDLIVLAEKWEKKKPAFLAFRGTEEGLDPGQVQYFALNYLKP